MGCKPFVSHDIRTNTLCSQCAHSDHVKPCKKSSSLAKTLDATVRTATSTRDGNDAPAELFVESAYAQQSNGPEFKRLSKSGSKINWKSLTSTAETWTLKLLSSLSPSGLRRGSTPFYHSGTLCSDTMCMVSKLDSSPDYCNLPYESAKKYIRTEPVENTYEIGMVLGTGLSGEVRRAVHRETGEVVAIKIVEHFKEANQNASMINFRKMLFGEISVISKFNHPNIIKFIQVNESHKKFHLVMEYCDAGDLHQYIQNCIQESRQCRHALRKALMDGSLTVSGRPLTSQDLCTYMNQLTGPMSEAELTQLLSAMLRPIAYLHSKNYVHRDIKAANFLFTSADEYSTGVYIKKRFFSRLSQSIQENDRVTSGNSFQKVRILLSDFGMTTKMKDNRLLQNSCGTPNYLAPEILMQSYGKEVDMWAFGVIVYLFIYGRFPFEGSSRASILKKIRHTSPTFPVTLCRPSDLALDFLKKCLQRDPKQRMTAMEGLQHPWLRPGTANFQYGYPLIIL